MKSSITTYKTLFSLLMVVSLYASSDFTTRQAPITNDYTIARVFTHDQSISNAVTLHKVTHSFSVCKSTISIHQFEHHLRTQNLLNQLQLSTQNHMILGLKPILLPIVLNEVSIQKSHCLL